MTTLVGVPFPLIPLGRRVILRKVEESTRNGIRTQLDGAPREEGSQEYVVVAGGCVISSGDNVWVLGPGQRVYLALHKGWKIETRDGEEWYAAEVDDILAVAIDAIDAIDALPKDGE